MAHETKSSGKRRLRMLCPRIPGIQIRETLQAMDDVMGADAASARDNLSRAQWQFTRDNCSGRRGCWGVCNHTDTTGSYIGSNHDGALAGLELIQDPIALILLLVTVDSYYQR
jgi:hypothetical protein